MAGAGLLVQTSVSEDYLSLRPKHYTVSLDYTTMIVTTDLALCIVFPILAILAVAGRFWARHLKHLSIEADDWTILIALVFCIGSGILGLVGGIYGDLGVSQPLGPNGFALPSPKLLVFKKVIYSSTIILVGSLTFSKLSILLFYRRIFPKRSFNILVWTMFGMNAFWGVAYTFVYIFQCVPVEQVFTTSIGEPGRRCWSQAANQSFAISSIVLDVVILIMPMPSIWELQMPVRQKLVVTGIFLLGTVVVAIGIVKCVAFFTIIDIIEKNHDTTHDEAPLFYYTIPESCLCVVSACLPTFRPLVHGFSPKSIIDSVFSAISLRSRDSDASKKSGNSHAFSPESTAGFAKMSEDATIENHIVRGPGLMTELEDLGDRDGIQIHRDFSQSEIMA